MPDAKFIGYLFDMVIELLSYDFLLVWSSDFKISHKSWVKTSVRYSALVIKFEISFCYVDCLFPSHLKNNQIAP